MRRLSHFLFSSAATAMMALSGTTHAAVVEYSFTSQVAVGLTPMAGYKPAAGDSVVGSFSYLAPDTAVGSPTKIIEGIRSFSYIYDLPAEAHMDFTIGGHRFTSDNVDLVITHRTPGDISGMPDSAVLMGLNLKIDGNAIPQGMAGFEFAYNSGTFVGGIPPDELQLNPFAYTLGYIVQNGDFGASGFFKNPALASATNAHFYSQTLTSPLPEPSTWAFMLLGFGAIAWCGARRQTSGR